MKTKYRSTELPEQAKPTSIESVKFRDGMIVTADDLDAAQRYPASLLHTVLRSYFGCGVVCGLGLRVKKTIAKPNWVVCVDRGVAIDCQGYPIELCASVELDLSPDHCDCDAPPEQVCIALRRITSDEAPHDACSCDIDGPHFDCRRIRDHVVVKAFSKAEFDALPETVCRRTSAGKEGPKGQAKNGGTVSSPQSWSDALCDSFTACPECTCGECWVLLGCVSLKEGEGITDKPPDTSNRRWVKPIEAVCPTLVDRIGELEKMVADQSRKAVDRIEQLEAQVASLTQQQTTQGAPTTQGPPTTGSPPTTQSLSTP